MAIEIRDHIHIDTMTLPVATYSSIQGTWDNAPAAPLAVDYALNGTVHAHRLLDGGGDIIVYEDTQMTLVCTLAEMLVLRALISSTVYFASNYHDDDEDGAGALRIWPDSTYVVRGTLRIPRNIAVDPMCTYWRMDIQITDIKAGP